MCAFRKKESTLLFISVPKWILFKENYEMVILHFLNEENYKKAIENLKFLKGERVLDFIYSYCHILMRHEPGSSAYFRNHLN